MLNYQRIIWVSMALDPSVSQVDWTISKLLSRYHRGFSARWVEHGGSIRPVLAMMSWG